MLAFTPRLPPALTRLAFLLYRGRRIRVEIDAKRARYELLDDEPLNSATTARR